MQSISSDRFEVPSSAPALGDGEIHLWLLALEEAPDHRAVAARTQTRLRQWLAHYSGSDGAVDIVRGEHGKPYAPALDGLDFNVSHAQDHVLLAFARRQPLGVDIERINRRLALDDLARRFFAPDEADALDAVPLAARLQAFLRLWTCKEAVLKAIGAGLSFGLDRVAFALDAHGMPAGFSHLAEEAGRPEEWCLSLLEPAAGHVGALAWRGSPRSIRCFRAHPDA